MSTTPRIEFKIQTKDHLAGVVIDSYIIEDNWSNSKIAKRHVSQHMHSTMSNILYDAMYNYDDLIEFKIHNNGLGGYIKVNDVVRYTVKAEHIEVYDEQYRTYRSFGITIMNNVFYLTQCCNGKVVALIDRESEIGIDDQYAEIYELIDAKYGD